MVAFGNLCIHSSIHHRKISKDLEFKVNCEASGLLIDLIDAVQFPLVVTCNPMHPHPHDVPEHCSHLFISRLPLFMFSLTYL